MELQNMEENSFQVEPGSVAEAEGEGGGCGC